MKTIVTLLFVVATTLVAALAAADSYDSAVARGVAARDRALETGHTADWQEALDLFQAAIELRPSKEAKFEFAEAAARLGRNDEAFAAYEDALDLGLSGRAEEQARAFLESHRGEMGALAVEGPTGARIYVNERKRAELPLARPLVVSPGKVRVHLDAPTFLPWVGEVIVESGTTTRLAPNLVHEPALRPPIAVVAPPAPRKRPAASPSESGSGWAMPALIGGGVLTVGGGAGIALTSVFVADEQSALEQDCVEFEGGACRATTQGKQSSAQSHADRISTLETLRWVSIGGAAVGLTAVLAGIVGVSGTGSESGSAGTASVRVSKDEATLQWQAEF